MKEIQVNQLVHKLCHIGIELSAEKDIDALLEMILKESMSIANCDAGSIYFIDGDGEKQQLEFKYTQNKSVDFPFKRFFMPLDKNSIAGACAVTGQIFNFKGMQETVEVLGFKHNTSYDESVGYHTMNMLVLPLKNYEEDIIGVLQLINKKSDDGLLLVDEDYQRIVPFTKPDEEIISALASQAAILIERTRLYEAIQETLESMISSLATALDQRDPITAGHSNRVAGYALALSEYLNQWQPPTGAESSAFPSVKPLIYQFTKDRLREIHIAGLLHDVGKIGVPEYLLMKEHKLSDSEMDAIENRFRYLSLYLTVKSQTQTLNPSEQNLLVHWQEDLAMLNRINGAGFLPDPDEARIVALGEMTVICDDHPIQVLKATEVEQMTIKRGNLTSSERQKINSHAKKSFELLSGIKWTKDLLRVPEIASQHHEKLNGQGYPDGLEAAYLSVDARVMAIADIFDALTAKDRPYKPAIPVDKSLAILDEEAARGALDPVLVPIFRQMIEEREANRHA